MDREARREDNLSLSAITGGDRTGSATSRLAKRLNRRFNQDRNFSNRSSQSILFSVNPAIFCPRGCAVSVSKSMLCAVIAFVTTYVTIWLLNGNPHLFQVGLIALAVVFGVNVGVRYRNRLDS